MKKQHCWDLTRLGNCKTSARGSEEDVSLNASMETFKLHSSNVYFVNAELAEAATRHLAELMGGVMDASKSLKAETSSAAPAQRAGATFFIGDSDAQEKQEASVDDPAADASAGTASSEVVMKDSKMEDKSAPQDDGAAVTVGDKCSTQDDSSQAKESCRISVGGASAPEKDEQKHR